MSDIDAHMALLEEELAESRISESQWVKYSVENTRKLLAALKDTIARAEKAEAERDKWKELAREAENPVQYGLETSSVAGFTGHCEWWLAKLKELEGGK